MLFFLGTHQPAWLGRTRVPLFISHRRLADQKTWPRALAPWALDSSGFTELNMHGRWTITAEEYADAVREYVARIGRLLWASNQDWMCEPFVLAKTGLTIEEHQARTIESCLVLRGLAPEVPWAPVLQGFAQDDYHRHAEQYAAAGIDLGAAPVVGVGSICRRQATKEAASILRSLAARGLRLHAFGFKTLGLPAVHDVIASSDSMAWSLAARRLPPLPECVAEAERERFRLRHSQRRREPGHKNCANCLRFALRWRGRILAALDAPPPIQPRWQQASLFAATETP